MEFKIGDDYDGARLDKFLRKHYKDLPLALIFKMIRNGKVKVNGKKKKENYRFEKGDILTVYTDEGMTQKEKFIKLTKDEIVKLKKSIVYENKDLIIYNKSAKEVMHKGSGFKYGLVDIFKAYYKNSDFSFVNRLDKDTKGLVIGSKNLKTTRLLTELIRERNVNKYYYAVIKGITDKERFTIENYIYNNGEKMKIVNNQEKGQKAVTNYELIKTNGKNSILKIELLTGRKHQIRTQLSHIGHPIVGDYKYGFKSNNRSEELYLISYKIEIPEIKLNVEIDIPKDFLNRSGS